MCFCFLVPLSLLLPLGVASMADAPAPTSSPSPFARDRAAAGATRSASNCEVWASATRLAASRAAAGSEQNHAPLSEASQPGLEGSFLVPEGYRKKRRKEPEIG